MKRLILIQRVASFNMVRKYDVLAEIDYKHPQERITGEVRIRCETRCDAIVPPGPAVEEVLRELLEPEQQVQITLEYMLSAGVVLAL